MQDHDHAYRARYTWIIDFVHERVTSASKIPVALLIVVNCLLYTASFQMRFCRSVPRPATGKSNCDSSRYRCASVPPRPYHRNRTFLHSSVRGLSGRRYRPALVHFFFSPPPLVFFRLSLSLTVYHRLPPLRLFSTVCLLFLSYYFFPSPVLQAALFVSCYQRFLPTYIIHLLSFITLHVSCPNRCFSQSSPSSPFFRRVLLYLTHFSPLNSLPRVTTCREKRAG